MRRVWGWLCLQQGDPYAAAAVETGDEAQRNDADDVIDDGGTQHGGAYPGVEPSQLPQSLHGDAHAGGGQNTADEQGIEQLFVAISGAEPVHEQHRPHKAQPDGHQHPHQCDERRRQPAALQLLQVGLQPAGEQDHDDPDLGKGVQHIHFLRGGVRQPVKAAAQPRKQRRPHQQSGDHHAHHLGQPAAPCQHAQRLGRHQNDGEIIEYVQNTE